MSTELTWLTLTVVFTALMWLPYVLNRIAVRGLVETVGYPDKPKPLAPWAERMRKAHANAVENLVIFAALVLGAQAAGVHSSLTVLATEVYLGARVVHFFAYAAKIPWLRTLGFFVGWLCCMVLAWAVLAT